MGKFTLWMGVNGKSRICLVCLLGEMPIMVEDVFACRARAAQRPLLLASCVLQPCSLSRLIVVLCIATIFIEQPIHHEKSHNTHPSLKLAIKTGHGSRREKIHYLDIKRRWMDYF
jgi:hypothetical protein